MTQKIISFGIAENTGRIDDVFFRALENFAVELNTEVTLFFRKLKRTEGLSDILRVIFSALESWTDNSSFRRFFVLIRTTALAV